ncbi:hypothetical protein LB506_001346 [Fusarium annulatum]|nr:hypothetical protein LB506_001346 [Fusarium annulatum]
MYYRLGARHQLSQGLASALLCSAAAAVVVLSMTSQVAGSLSTGRGRVRAWTTSVFSGETLGRKRSTSEGPVPSRLRLA